MQVSVMKCGISLENLDGDGVILPQTLVKNITSRGEGAGKERPTSGTFRRRPRCERKERSE